MGQRGTWSRADGEAFEGWLRGLGVEHEALDAAATEALRSRWRDVYARGVDHAGSARPGFEFETFANGSWPSLRGAAALRAYGARREIRYYVLPDPSLSGMPAYRCSSLVFPTFEGDDLMVCPLDLSWTMVFTHDDGSAHGGPFFARADAEAA